MLGGCGTFGTLGATVWSNPFCCACASACILASAAVPPFGVASCDSFWPLAGACHTSVSQSQDYLRLTTTIRTSSIGTYRLRELLLHISVGGEKLTRACSAKQLCWYTCGTKVRASQASTLHVFTLKQTNLAAHPEQSSLSLLQPCVPRAARRPSANTPYCCRRLRHD